MLSEKLKGVTRADAERLRNIRSEVRHRGTLYFDKSMKRVSFGHIVRINRWCAEINIDGKRYRMRSKDREKFVAWLMDMTDRLRPDSWECKTKEGKNAEK